MVAPVHRPNGANGMAPQETMAAVAKHSTERRKKARRFVASNLGQAVVWVRLSSRLLAPNPQVESSRAAARTNATAPVRVVAIASA